MQISLSLSNCDWFNLCRLREAILKILEGKENLKNNFLLGGKGGSSFAIFGLCVGLCELQM